MKIIILGAGKVGSTLAESLVNEKNDITIVDIDSNPLRQLQDKFDLRAIKGYGSYPNVLNEAGASNADILIAVTGSDETNMIICQIAYTLFKIPNKIARIRSHAYSCEAKNLFFPEAIPVDYLISPEKLVADNIYRLIEYPGALHVINFSNKKVSIVSSKAYYGGSLVGNSIFFLKKHMPNIESRIIAIFRKEKLIKPQSSTIIEADDEVFFIVSSQYIRAIMSEIQRLEKPYKRIMIVGGGNIGADLAYRLEKKCNIKLIESNQERAIELSEKLHNTIVFYGDASNQELLSQEHIDQIDVFIALTNNDEANIMSSMLAKKMGAKKTIVLIQCYSYLNLVENNIIDIVISPQQTTISALLKHVRKADIVNIAKLRIGSSEIIEAIIHGNKNNSQLIGRNINDIKLPTGSMICAIIRGNKIIISDRNKCFEQGDHVIIFLNDKKFINDIEKLLQPVSIFFK